MMNRNVVVAYVPVLHQGCIDFFRQHKNSVLYLLGSDFFGEEYERLNRDIRALSTVQMQAVISSLHIFSSVKIAEKKFFHSALEGSYITMPDEDFSRFVAESYLPNCDIVFETTFLRFDMPSSMSTKPVHANESYSLTKFDSLVMLRAYNEAQHSPDIWRQVGAALVKDGVVIDVAHNHHMPSDQISYALGDPRGNFNPGECSEITLAHHAEKVLISRAARRGFSTDGTAIYTTTFPCPSCANDIVVAGIKTVYYCEGYSSLLAMETLQEYKVKIIHVEMTA